MNYLKDMKSWKLATLMSLAILLFNVLFVAKLLNWLGGCTQEAVAILSISLFFARYILFYALLVWRAMWGAPKTEKP